jgi:hypothetical protein
MEKGDDFMERKKNLMEDNAATFDLLFKGFEKFMQPKDLEKLKKQQIDDVHIDEAHKANFLIKPGDVNKKKPDEIDEVVLTPNDFLALI